MRYPGPHRHHLLLRSVTLLVAVALFVVGLTAASAKQRHESEKNRRNYSFSKLIPSPTPTDEGAARLRFYDQVTGQPLSGQSVAFVATASCPPGGACPAASPLVYGLDEQGRVVVPRSLLTAIPKLYVSSYKLDTYFAFLSTDRPTELTLYKAPDEARLTYDVAAEEVPIWLAPAE